MLHELRLGLVLGFGGDAGMKTEQIHTEMSAELPQILLNPDR
ncbi:hypothetical protein [Neorhodopirellula pilleata]|uniref:Uncharacterized protein n=1 Tax=Neorhodopirellula pilleata TaxID=2714738 RepID=A0A5C6A8L1_9BACT|nr:hypothetical protein [Neorhodopirellula pilleata]TWT96342.1 hypothetical protein Pla100_28190 [Neorhodopirellula pilleata]